MVDDRLVNVIDLEATCFKPWAGKTQDIIEIGISVVDPSTSAIVDTRSILVRPTYSAITPFRTSLTTLTPDQVEQEGVYFKEAVAALTEKYYLPTRLFASYGAFDLRLVKQQLKREGVGATLPASFLNMKQLVATSYKRKDNCGMMKALTACQLEHKGVHHRGGDDSRNISRVLLCLLKRHAENRVIQQSVDKVAHVR